MKIFFLPICSNTIFPIFLLFKAVNSLNIYDSNPYNPGASRLSTNNNNHVTVQGISGDLWPSFILAQVPPIGLLAVKPCDQTKGAVRHKMVDMVAFRRSYIFLNPNISFLWFDVLKVLKVIFFPFGNFGLPLLYLIY